MKPLFDFALRPLPEVMPWGQPPQQSLHWFGLTDGWYQVNLGARPLYLPSAAHLQRWQASEPGRDLANDPFAQNVDYPVVRLWEDLQERLPHIAQPVPERLADLCADPERYQHLLAQYDQPLPNDESDENGDARVLATDWLAQRTLGAAHLRMAPWVVFLRVAEQVHMVWQCPPEQGEAPIWQPGMGCHRLAWPDFVAEVQRFDQRLMQAMAERVAALQDPAVLPDIAIDRPRLLTEQAEREAWLHKAWHKPVPAADWNAVHQANRTLYGLDFLN